MSIAIVETVTANIDSGITIDVVFSAAPSDGEMIVFVVGTRGSTKGACTGFTEQHTGVGAGANNTALDDWIHVLTKEASSEGSATYTITGLGNDVHAVIGYRLSTTIGWYATPIEDGSGIYLNSIATSMIVPDSTATVQASGEAILIAAGALRQDMSAETWSWTNSFVQDDEVVGGSSPYMTTKAASRIVSSTTTVGTTISWTTSDSYQLGAMLTIIEAAGGATTSGELNAGGSITASVTKYENQVARPVSTITAGDWDTGPTPGQALHTYAGDDSDATWIEDTTV